jgi:hypothetical protein
MTLLKLKATVLAQAKELKAGKSKKIELIKFNRNCYKPKLSSPYGIGNRDLKKNYFELYIWMLTKYRDKLSTEASPGMSTKDFSVTFILKK